MGDLNLFCERMRYWCEQGDLGYDQQNRWDIREGGECDCSSLVIFALREAGFDTGGATYTGNMSAELCARGWERVPADGNPQRGDVLLNDASHVAVWLGDRLAQASIDERGCIAGGASGDQGGETNTRGYYDYPWDCYLRPAGESEDDMVPNDVWAFTNNGKQSGAPGTAWQNLMDTNRRVQAIEVQVAALSEAVKTLAKAKGADPSAIAESVDKAVRDRLAKIKVSVK